MRKEHYSQPRSQYLRSAIDHSQSQSLIHKDITYTLDHTASDQLSLTTEVSPSENRDITYTLDQTASDQPVPTARVSRL